MKALVKDKKMTEITQVHVPDLDDMNTVLIQVELAGICRTDINVSKGRMPSAERLILGHEFYGHIADIRSNRKIFKVGDKVTINPSQFGRYRNLMCGIDVDGCYTEYIKAPEWSVYPLPEHLSPTSSAFVEPIAASLAVLKANLDKNQIGCIYGNNRIANLTYKIMRAKGYTHITMHHEKDELEPYYYDYVIETRARTEDISKMIHALKIGGKLVLKSRQVTPVEMIFNTLVRKEITLIAVNYGCYQEAIELLASGQLDLSDLTGEMYPLEDFEKAFEASESDESKKCYFKV